MQTITVELKPKLANRFDTYVQLFGSKELLFDKFFDYHINRIKREISRMQIELDKYEKKHNLKTDDFYKKFETGEFGDESDYMIWAGIYELQLDSKNKLNKLL